MRAIAQGGRSGQIELLVNYTAGDGFLFRQRALAAIRRDLQLNVAGLTVALLLSGLFSWMLARGSSAQSRLPPKRQ
ncbi:hypothetical protein LRP30_21250 [Bradyrhizobium sp. C-145]|uniref:hypothetical protein n=1 Tax=unclassified Bradyrhizobium TaxID=2631580 RepID=UPI00159FBDD4|nr:MULTISPECIES: hypothetical protein [unclassified Bradyrhizobium]UQR67620.1 hypothetical protein LRP30_21250 [Bradyrhizobium sp. C-145]